MAEFGESEGAKALTALSVFALCYLYSIYSYGFLWGVGLGWLPAAILAALAYVSARIIVPLLIIAACAAFVAFVWHIAHGG